MKDVLTEDRLEQLIDRFDCMVSERQATLDEEDVLVALQELVKLRETVTNAYLALIDISGSVGILNVDLTDAIEFTFHRSAAA